MKLTRKEISHINVALDCYDEEDDVKYMLIKKKLSSMFKVAK